eukprot:2473326-Rhodomonas_salina.2
MMLTERNVQKGEKGIVGTSRLFSFLSFVCGIFVVRYLHASSSAPYASAFARHSSISFLCTRSVPFSTGHRVEEASHVMVFVSRISRMSVMDCA